MLSLLDNDITYLKKVGPKRAKVLLSECGIRTYGDLLHYYPRKYVDRSRVSTINSLRGDGSTVTLTGKILDMHKSQTAKGMGRLTADFTDGTGVIELTWFRGIRWIEQKLSKGVELAIFGKIHSFNGRLQINHPEIDFLRDEQNATLNTLSIIPFYASSDKLGRVGLDVRGFRQLMRILLEAITPHIRENLSTDIIRHYGLVPRDAALNNIHFPTSTADRIAAERRLKFEEFFFFQLLLAMKRGKARAAHQAHPFLVVGDLFHHFYKEHMPFALTGAQKRVIKEIRRDIRQPVQMNRLVQGDVGSGKTIVAFLSMLIARDNGFQSCLMAPTEILANQHYRKLSAHAAKLGQKVVLVVGGQRKRARREALEALASGEALAAVGTHALIEDPVVFQKTWIGRGR